MAATIQSKTKVMNEDSHFREDVHSISVRAGKRTYFFDVKTTRGNDLYLTITESKRMGGESGDFTYEKHKLFLYKEDFENFMGGLEEAVNKIHQLKSTGRYPDDGPMDRKHKREQEEGQGQTTNQQEKREEKQAANDGSNGEVRFEDL